MPPPFLCWLVLPERQRRSYLYRARTRASRPWHFFHELLRVPHQEVVADRLKSCGFPPWARHDFGFCDEAAEDIVAEGEWARWRPALHRARGRIVGAVLLSAPEAAVSQLQLHSAEHRVWERGTLPSLKPRLATFKVLDVFALGNFMWLSALLAANDPMLHPVYSSQKGSDFDGAAWDYITDQCVQNPSFSKLNVIQNVSAKNGIPKHGSKRKLFKTRFEMFLKHVRTLQFYKSRIW